MELKTESKLRWEQSLKKPMIYVIAPFMSPSLKGIKENLQITMRLMARLFTVGKGRCGFIHPPLMTHDMWRYMVDVLKVNMPEQFWYGFAGRMLLDCDGVLLVPNWHESEGCNLERNLCLKHRIPYLQLLVTDSDLDLGVTVDFILDEITRVQSKKQTLEDIIAPLRQLPSLNVRTIIEKRLGNSYAEDPEASTIHDVITSIMQHIERR